MLRAGVAELLLVAFSLAAFSAAAATTGASLDKAGLRLSTAPNQERPAALPSSGRRPSGQHAPPVVAAGEFLRHANGTVQNFSTCTNACDQCYADHYQGCLAYCKVGCQDYCTTVLPEPDCERQQVWMAQVAYVVEALDAKARMCQATGINGCPERPKMQPTPLPLIPYDAAAAELPRGKRPVLDGKASPASAPTPGGGPAAKEEVPVVASAAAVAAQAVAALQLASTKWAMRAQLRARPAVPVPAAL